MVPMLGTRIIQSEFGSSRLMRGASSSTPYAGAISSALVHNDGRNSTHIELEGSDGDEVQGRHGWY